jgi:gas vesicle protein
MTSADVADNQVAYWVSDETLLDFDVYQFAKEGLPELLEEYVANEAAAHSAADTGVQTFNGITVGWYRTVEAWEGRDYDTLTCVLDAGDEYVEVVFWLDGLTAAAEADAIIKSLWMEDETWADGVDEPSESVEDEVADDAGEVADAADEWAGEVADAATEWADEAADAAGEWAGEVADAAGEWASETADAVGEWADETAEAVGEWAGEAADAVGEWAGETAEAVGEWADEAANTAGEWADEAAEITDEWAGEALDATDGAMDVPVETEAPATRLLRLGTSPFTLVVPGGFVEGEMTQEDVEDDQVAYYYSNDTLLDFDVYQFSKDGYPNDLATYAQEETSGYNSVTDLGTGVINGIYAAWYRTVEEYNNATFDTLTYILDGGDEYVEICFWLDGDTADAEADAIIRTLASDKLPEPVGGGGAVVVEPIEETTAPQRTSLDEFEAAVSDAAEGQGGEAVAPADGPDAIEEPAEEPAGEPAVETAGDEAVEAPAEGAAE